MTLARMFTAANGKRPDSATGLDQPQGLDAERRKCGERAEGPCDQKEPQVRGGELALLERLGDESDQQRAEKVDRECPPREVGPVSLIDPGRERIAQRGTESASHHQDYPLHPADANGEPRVPRAESRDRPFRKLTPTSWRVTS